MEQVFQQTHYKKTYKIQQKRTKSNSSEDLEDCSCEILFDTELSDVSDTDCSCSQCMEANLDAFNQVIHTKETHIEEQRTKKKTTKRYSQSQTKFNQASKTKENVDSNQFDKDRHCRRHFSPDAKLNKRTQYKYQKIQQVGDKLGKLNRRDIDDQELNDFMIITQHRTRNYLRELKKKSYNQKMDSQKYKERIAQNLQMLKYSAKLRRKRQPEQGVEVEEPSQSSVAEKDAKYPHKYKWNHSQYRCLCNGKETHKHKDCCAYPIADHPKKKLNTNLQKLNPHFVQNRQQILRQAKEKRLNQLKPKHQLCPYDKCQNHHMRTSKRKLQKIQKFIHKKARQYKKKKAKKAKQADDAQKIKEAKLRAIEIKSKQILAKSKKHQKDDDRTSFQLSIDNYATFSELRQVNAARVEDKKKSQKIKKMVKYGGGEILENVYKDAMEEEEQVHYNAQKGKKNKSPPGLQKKAEVNEEPYGKIVRDAKIYSPQKLKQEDAGNKKKQGKPKQKTLANVTEEEKKKKKVEAQIARKKAQIIEEFQKRNSNVNRFAQQPESKKKQLQEEYEKETKKKQKASSRAHHASSQKNKDPFRNVYETAPEKGQKQVSAVADPLVHEYLYHQQLNLRNKAEQKHDKEIFSSNVHYLTGKKRLQL